MDTALAMGGTEPLDAGSILNFLTATDYPVSPYELDAALLASSAYVYEYRRSNDKSTDAPWDWPKTERDIEILNAQADKAMDAIMGG